jgi:site-specific DNA-methyltransferase (adenine-specific)
MKNNISKEMKEASKLTSEEWKEWTKTVWHIANTSDPSHPAVFPQEIPYRLIRMFSFVGETVLDPFSGVATTGKAAIITNRTYKGFEINPDFYKESMKRLDECAEKAGIGPAIYSIENTSSYNMASVADDSIGIVVTSPPYWNKANYGEYEGNIGNFKFYDDFLLEIEKVFSECYRVLIPGRKMCVITANVNQNTAEYGLLTIPLAADMTKALQKKGFVLINQIIWNKDGTGGRWGSANSQRPIFGSYPYPPNFLFKNVNEYIIIVQKPDPLKKNSNAPSYTELFRGEPM